MTRSKYFLLFCIAFISGIFLGSYFSISIWILFLLAGFFISLIFLFRKNTRPPDKEGWGVKENNFISYNGMLLMLILIVFTLLGFARIESVKLSEKKIFEIESLNDRKMILEGKIFESPEIKNGKQKIILENLKDIKNSNDIDGKIIVYAERYPEYNFSDKISVNGKINIPEDFDGFEYKNYLFAKGIYYIVYYSEIEIVEKNDAGINFQISQFRIYANELIKKIFPAPQAGIVSAMTLGVKSSISSETLESFNKTGTRHIIAISGLHMTIVSVIFMYLLLAVGLKRNYAFYFAILGIVFFVALVGFPPSAVRASVMGGLVLFAEKVGRLRNAGNAVIFAGVLMLLYDPNLLRYDTGFQLSFLAVLGIIYIYSKLDLYLKKYPDRLKIKTMFLITISAQIATLPIIISSFGNFSLLSVFANVLILPFVPVVMLGGFLVMIIGFVNLFIAQILSWPIWFVLVYQIEIIKFFASFDFGYFSFESGSVWIMAVYYGVLVLTVKYMSEKKDVNTKHYDTT